MIITTEYITISPRECTGSNRRANLPMTSYPHASMPRGIYNAPSHLSLGRHKTRPVILSLVVDDFCVQYTGHHNAEHLLTTLLEHYKVSTDWKGAEFVGINLAWNYVKRTFQLTMDGYITNVCTGFNHPNPHIPQNSPYKHRCIVYGAKAQLVVNNVNTSPPLDKIGVKNV